VWSGLHFAEGATNFKCVHAIAIAVYKVVLFYLSLRHKSSTCVARAVWAVDVGLENALRHCFSLMVDLSLKKYLWLKDLHGIPHNITSPTH